jgi:hypothetical protein
MNTTKSLRAKLVSVLASLGLGALLALGVASPSHAATVPDGSVTLTGTATCGTNGNYSVTWTAESTPLQNFGVSIPTAYTPAGSVIPRGIWIHNSRVHTFVQNVIPGDSTSATVTTTVTIYTAARTLTLPIVGSVTLEGSCSPTLSVSQIHKAFAHLHRR